MSTGAMTPRKDGGFLVRDRLHQTVNQENRMPEADLWILIRHYEALIVKLLERLDQHD
jgi:hypothetical protein